MIDIPHRLVRSKRRTLALQIAPDSTLVIRAPQRLAEKDICGFISRQMPWILKKQRQMREFQSSRPPQLSDEEKKKYKNEARELISRRTKYFSEIMGARYSKIRIGDASTRWGSCGPTGNLNFNWRLVLAPGEVVDYVVIHELAHLSIKDHSARFWKLVARYCPEHLERRRWLRKNGSSLG